MSEALRFFHRLNFLSGLLLVMLLLSLITQSSDAFLFFNSDTLYLPSIYLDVFVHGTGISGWHLNASPNFFPDMIAYAGLMSILKKAALTSFVFHIIQFGAIMVLVYFVVKTWDPESGTETHILTGMAVLLFLVSPVLGEDPLIAFQLLVPSFHCGYFINSLIAMIVGMHYLRRGSISMLILTGLITVLAVISDRIFLVGYLFPLFILTFLSVIRNPRDHRYIILFAVTLASSVLGWFLFAVIERDDALTIIGTGWKMFNFSNMGPSFLHLAEHMVLVIRDQPVQRWSVILALLFIISAPVYLIGHLVTFLKNELDQERKQQFMLILFLFTFSVTILFTPVINGSYLGPAHIRFNFAALVLGSVGFVYLLILHLKRYKSFDRISGFFAIGLSLGLVVLILIVGTTHRATEGIRNYINYYPEKSQILDRLKDSHGLKYGIANYWHAKQSTIFSHNDVRVYAVFDESLRPYYHATNENWYHDGGKGVYANPVFNFIYADSVNNTNEILIQVFGKQLDTIYAQNGALVIKLPEFKIDRKTRSIIPLNQTTSD